MAVALRNQRKKRAPSANSGGQHPGPPPGSGLYTYNGRIYPAAAPNPDSIELAAAAAAAASSSEDHFYARRFYQDQHHRPGQPVSIAHAVEVLQRRQGRGGEAVKAVGRLRGQVLRAGQGRKSQPSHCAL